MTGPVERPAVGLVLAGGSGSRLGQPKALVVGLDGESWLARAVRVLVEGGCNRVYAVVGAAADAVRGQAPPDVEVVVAVNWAEGMGASLHVGVTAVADREPDATAIVVMLVDTPGVEGGVVRRLVSQSNGADALARATYDGRVGHPVLVGRDHWPGVMASAQGDRGARDYLATQNVTLVECGDLGSGDDIDDPSALRRWRSIGG